MEKDSAEMTAIVGNIYKKTIAYDLEKVVINEDRTTSHLHSDSFWINIQSDVRLHSSLKRKNLNNLILWLQWQNTMSKRDLFVIIYCSVWGSLGVILTTLVYFNNWMEVETFALIWDFLFLLVTSSFVFIKPIGRFVDNHIIEKLS